MLIMFVNKVLCLSHQTTEQHKTRREGSYRTKVKVCRTSNSLSLLLQHKLQATDAFSLSASQHPRNETQKAAFTPQLKEKSKKEIIRLIH